MPLTTIITPGAITVEPAIVKSTRLVPILDHDTSLGRYTMQYNRSYVPGDVIHFPTLRKAKFLTLLTGELLSIPKSETTANITYELTFNSPSISCSDTDDTTKEFVSKAVSEYENQLGKVFTYLAFVPQTGFGQNMNTSFFNQPGVSPLNSVNVTYLDTFSKDVSRIIVLTRDEIEIDDDSNASSITVNGNMFSCAFYNATYTTSFELFSDGTQNVTTQITPLNRITARDHIQNLVFSGSMSGATFGGEKVGFLGLMDLLGSAICGSAVIPRHIQPGLNMVTQAISEAKGDVMYMSDTIGTVSTSNSYKKYVESLFLNFTLGARYSFPTVFDGPTSDEEVYRNVSAQATYTQYRNQFRYRPKDLIIVYSLSVSFATLCVLIGGYAMIANRGCYSNDFSTYVRIASSLQLKDPICDNRPIGAYPPSKETKRIIVDLRQPFNHN